MELKKVEQVGKVAEIQRKYSGKLYSHWVCYN